MKDMENHVAKQFALQLGSLVSLYLSLSFFLVLVFGLINLIFTDSVDSVYQIENYADMVRLGFAMTIVFFPTYLWLTRTVNHSRRTSSDGTYLNLTKWLIYLSLLVGGGVLLGDLVAIIMGFLNGELTTRFILKAVAVLVVTGAACYYYVKDAQGYWVHRERQSLLYAGTAAVLIFGTLVVSLAYIETPAEVREQTIDNQMLGDLQDMQWRIEDYYRSNDSLPADLATLYGQFPVPTPPETRPAYEYNIQSETEYQLCATFLQDSTLDSMTRPVAVSGKNYSWDYKAGYWCFEREIDGEYRQ